ncbi:MAG TPA: preprotein translocase subunit YajC [Candidatus Nanopelagicales bacterium]|nr:preprotein translocase subunit YajC [Candidatus Nanopelagicales bacterium]
MDPNGLLLIIVVLGAFYLLVVRPARNRQKSQQATVSRVVPGVRVMTTAGLFGTVTAVEDDQIDLEIAPGVTVRYVTAAVARIVETPSIDEPDAAAPGPAGTPEEPGASQSVDDTPDS